MGFPVGFVFGQSVVCVCKVYCLLAELNEVLDQLRHFCVRFVDFPEMFRITPRFFLGGSSNVVDVAHTGLSGAVPRFTSFSLFPACIDLVAHNIVQLQSERK